LINKEFTYSIKRTTDAKQEVALKQKKLLNYLLDKGGSMTAILGLVVLVLDIIAIIDVLKSLMATGKKVLWIILILVLPLVGMVLYFLIGKKQ
jgi:hypothetical protein